MLPEGKLFLHVPAFQFLYSAMDKKSGIIAAILEKNLSPNVDRLVSE